MVYAAKYPPKLYVERTESLGPLCILTLYDEALENRYLFVILILLPAYLSILDLDNALLLFIL